MEVINIQTGTKPVDGWLSRPVIDTRSLEEAVAAILSTVKLEGDAAVREYSLRFDKSAPARFGLSAEEIADGAAQVSMELRAAIEAAYANILAFHQQQRLEESVVEVMPGVKCWRRSVGIEKVGLYIPGGTAPLFSTLLMLAIPARIAGCKEIVLCSPPDGHGQLHPAILFAAQLVGVTRIFRIGGVQAIAAMAYGTESVPKVYKIFGPGNQYVTCAKQLVQREGTAIDLPAGPSEVAVYADESCDPLFVAADLLSQAEHGADSQVVLVSNSETVVTAVLAEVERQVSQLPRSDIAQRALAHSRAFIVRDSGQA
ncbi:MAG TPA: histidinol dehydrogenase, partial [Puia sp.]